MCPLTNQKLSEVQDILGEQFGRDIFFVSVSLDPETDTPEVLKDYAAKFEARDGWLFLTGKKDNLKKITYQLGQTNPMIEAHNPYFMLGNVKIARWTKLTPNLPAEAIAARARQMAEHTATN
jgi:protein SCO1/2